MISQLETLKASYLNAAARAPGESVCSRPASVPEDEQKLALAMAHNLADAILAESAAAARGTVWGAGMDRPRGNSGPGPSAPSAPPAASL